MDGLHKKIAAYMSRLATISIIREESFEVKTIIYLLVRHWHDGKKRTKEEEGELRVHFKNPAKIVYPLFIFLLPGGLFFLPFLTYWLHKPKG